MVKVTVVCKWRYVQDDKGEEQKVCSKKRQFPDFDINKQCFAYKYKDDKRDSDADCMKRWMNNKEISEYYQKHKDYDDVGNKVFHTSCTLTGRRRFFLICESYACRHFVVIIVLDTIAEKISKCIIDQTDNNAAKANNLVQIHKTKNVFFNAQKFCEESQRTVSSQINRETGTQFSSLLIPTHKQKEKKSYKAFHHLYRKFHLFSIIVQVSIGPRNSGAASATETCNFCWN